jgi:hypothetical protein
VHLKDHDQRRGGVYTILFLLPFMSFFHLLAIVLVRSQNLFEILISFLEVQILYEFFYHIVAQCGGLRATEAMLATVPAANHYKALPCCIFGGCCDIGKFTPGLFRFVKFLIWQMIFVRPTIIFVKAIVVLDDSAESSTVWWDYIDNASTAFAIWGLVMFYSATSSTLSALRTNYKFFAIIAILSLTCVGEVVLGWFEAGNVFHDLGEFPAYTMGEVYRHCLIAAELVILGFFVRDAFPTSDYNFKGFDDDGTALTGNQEVEYKQ